jgi:hypothetical protein
LGEARLTLADIERAIATRDPQLGEMLVRYLEQPDPEPGRDELGSDDDAPEVDVPPGAVTLSRLKTAVGGGLAGKNPTERKLARREAFEAAEASLFAPPRLRLGKLLVAVYDQGDDAGRAALMHAMARVVMKWGIWQAAKAIYKRAEDRHDAAFIGVLGYRFDALPVTRHEDIGAGTMVYLRRRVWRYLRRLGQTVPDAYPTYAVELLRHYPADHGAYTPSWVAAQIWGHGQLIGARGSASFGLPHGDAMAVRAFPAAWKVSPAPLLRLLDAANNEIVCEFAIRSLRADHPLALRAVEPAWLARLGRRPIAAIHSFVVSLLKDSPELHQSKLRELGLHDVVIGFLKSPAPDARQYALEYAAAHGGDLTIEQLMELMVGAAPEVTKFASARLEAMSAQQLGLHALLRLLGNAAAPWAQAKLTQAFSPKDIDAQLFVDTAARGTAEVNALVKFWSDKSAVVPAGHWTKLLDDPRFSPTNYSMRQIIQLALTELGKRPASEIGVAWIQKSLEDRARTDVVTRWLDAGMLAGNQLDVEWLKGLVGKPRLRPIALRLLGDRRRVAPAAVGLAWLLDLARSSDQDLATFAQRMLLESFEPADFANGDHSAGVARLWELATGAKQPEAVRTFAQTYLKAHHPDLGPRLPEARALGIRPRLDHDEYPLSTVRPLLFDDRADVRRLAVAIAGEEIVRWNEPEVVYQLTAASHREPRALGAELLLGVVTEGDGARRVPAAWLDGARMFWLAESPHK